MRMRGWRSSRGSAPTARGEDFYDAYAKACDDNPDLAATAVGTVAPPPGEVTKAEADFGLALRDDPVTKGHRGAGLSRTGPRGALLKRARDVQVERASERLSLLDALRIAEAERPELVRATRHRPQ